MEKLEIEQKVKEIVALQFDAKLEDIGMTTNFITDLSVDSLDTVEMMMGVEDRFDLVINDEGVDGLLTVQAVADFVEKKIANKGSE